MPTSKWNKSYWMEDIKKFNDGERIKKCLNEKHYGDRWGDAEGDPNLKSIIEKYIIPFETNEKTALEIGPGGGRLTKYLLGFRTVYLVDLNSNSLNYVKHRFGSNKNLQFYLNNGNDFPDIPSNQIDYVFSYGTFVHIDLGDIVHYFANLIQILSDKADIVLQYPEKLTKIGMENKSYAQNSREVMKKLIVDFGFEVQSEVCNINGESNLVHFSYDATKQNYLSKKESPEEIIDFWYNKILKRNADELGLQLFRKKFEQNTITEKDFVLSLLTSDEYKIQIDDFCTHVIKNSQIP